MRSPQYGQGRRSLSDTGGRQGRFVGARRGTSGGGASSAGAGGGSLSSAAGSTGAVPFSGAGAGCGGGGGAGAEDRGRTASNVPPQVGHLTFSPSNSSGTRSLRSHDGQSTMVDISSSPSGPRMDFLV